MRSEQQLREFLDLTSITTELKSRGFRKKGLTWTRTRDGVAHVVEFQRSRFSDPGSVKFTVNMGVALEVVWRIYFGGGFGGSIHEADCFPRFRVGDALAGFQKGALDVWWTIDEHGGSDALVAAVKLAVLQTCLPILDRLDSVDAVFRFANEEVPPSHANAPFTRIVWAIICHLRGDTASASSQLSELEFDPRLGMEWRDRIRDVRSRLERIRDSGE